MIISTKLAAAVMGGLLLAALSTPAWAGSANDATGAGQSQTALGAAPAGSAQLEMLIPMLKNPEHHEAQKSCKAPGMYSSHDVVGDPEACFMGRLGSQILPGGFSGGGVF